MVTATIKFLTDLYTPVINLLLDTNRIVSRFLGGIADAVEGVLPFFAGVLRRVSDTISAFIFDIVSALNPLNNSRRIVDLLMNALNLLIAPFRALRDVFTRFLELAPVTGGNVVLTILETIRDFLQQINDITNDIIDLVPDIDFPDIGIPSFLNRNRGVTVPWCPC